MHELWGIRARNRQGILRTFYHCIKEYHLIKEVNHCIKEYHLIKEVN
jgi:hypothetical protein